MFPNIFAAMAARGRMTIKQLSKESGIPERTLSMKLNGKTDFTLSNMLSIQRVLYDKNGKTISLDVLFALSED